MERDHIVDMPRWKDGTKMDHNENVWKGLQYIDLVRIGTDGALIGIFGFHRARGI